MSNCAKAAIERGYIVQQGDYDEIKKDFVDLDSYYIPIRTKPRTKPETNLTIKYCPICGNLLFPVDK